MYMYVYVCAKATAYTVWANKLKIELRSPYMIISKCIFFTFLKKKIITELFTLIIVFHNFLYIKSMNLPIKKINMSNTSYELLENIMYSLIVSNLLWRHQMTS